MKKILYLFALTMFILSSCDPMSEIYDELDEMSTGYKNSVEYTLTEDDYAAIADITTDPDASEWIGEEMYFTDMYSAADYVPDYLEVLYPALSEGSSAMITYKFNNEIPDDLVDYTELDEYELEMGSYYLGIDGDYESSDDVLQVVNYYSPGYAPEAYIPMVLEQEFTSPSGGDLLVVEYEYSNVTPDVDFSGLQILPFWKNGLNEDLGDFEVVSVDDSSSTWYQSGYGGDSYAKISAYNDGFNEDWLISPEVTLEGNTSYYLNFRHTAKYVFGRWDLLTVWVSADYDGDITTATWDPISGYNLPAGDDYVFVESGNVDLSSYDGETVVVAFKYMSEVGSAATWEIDQVEFRSPQYATVGADPVTLETVYRFENNTWGIANDIYIVTGPDYDAMGAPGSYNNFSGSDLPYDYIPALLTDKFPLAGEETEKTVIYDYYTGISGVWTITLADKYVFTDGAWMSTYQYVGDVTSQFLYSGGTWVFDPTVIFTMVGADYQMIVTWLDNNGFDSYVSSYGDSETYTGAGAYYSNFDYRAGHYETADFDSQDEAVAWSIANALLPTKFPAAVTDISGVPVFYVVTFATYDGSDGTKTMTFQCTKSAPAPEFTFVE